MSSDSNSVPKVFSAELPRGDAPDSSADYGALMADLREAQDQFMRDRALATNRSIYEWDHLPGLPAFCRGLPDQEKVSRYKSARMAYDLGTSLAEAAIGMRGFKERIGQRGNQLSAYDHLRPLGPKPAVSQRWKSDEEFARQRLNGVNPLQIQGASALPEHMAIDDERLAGVLPAGTTLAQLLDQGRLFICDWGHLVDAPVTLGRFLTAPTVLFWTDERGVLMPLAIQLDRTPGSMIFTPADDHWVWLYARTHVQSADAAYHETVVHLFRTHLIMETVWVATNRGLPPQHPIHELLAPHFAGTIDINHKARTELLVPGGPIDEAISVGTDGAYWLINQALGEFSFGDLDPAVDIENRRVGDHETLGHYYYRDDALRIWDTIGSFAEEVLRVFYPDDASVAADDELAEWATQLSDTDHGGIAGLPLVDGRLQRFEDLHHVVRQVIFTVSAEHSAVNNGQYDIFGCIPNAPGALFLPPPTTLAAGSEGEFTYALPPFKIAEEQITLVHLLSAPTEVHLGDYPREFFHSRRDVRVAVDRFRKNLDELMIDIRDRNTRLEMPYTYLDPATVAASVNV